VLGLRRDLVTALACRSFLASSSYNFLPLFATLFVRCEVLWNGHVLSFHFHREGVQLQCHTENAMSSGQKRLVRSPGWHFPLHHAGLSSLPGLEVQVLPKVVGGAFPIREAAGYNCGHLRIVGASYRFLSTKFPHVLQREALMRDSQYGRFRILR